MNKLIFRIKHGFWKSDLWSLDYTIAKFVYPRLKCFVENNRVGSCYVDPEDMKKCGLKPAKKEKKGGDVHKNWQLVLNEMLFAIDYLANNREIQELDKVKNGDYSEVIKIKKRVHNGLVLFGLYFQGLWD